MPKNTSTKFAHLSDQELVVLIQENQEYLGEVYKRSKSYCIKFMRKMTSSTLNDYELEDVYHDAVMVLYEKIIKGNFVLTASLQIYLNSVCRFQLLNKLKKSNTVNIVDGDGNLQFNPLITDVLDPISDEKEAQTIALEKALELMKNAGGKCYDLIIQFWYHKKSIKDLTNVFGYTNEVNTRNQKSKCQERLRTLAFNAMQNN